MKTLVGFLSISLFALLLLVIFAKNPIKSTQVIVEPTQLGAVACETSADFVRKVSESKDPNVSDLQKNKSLNDSIDSFLTSFDTIETNYIRTEGGKYFQGLDSDKNEKPYYQNKDWADLGVDKASLPFVVRVDQYKNHALGCGWQAVFSVMMGQDKYSKSIGKGPNANDYGYDWRKDEKPY